MDSRINGWMEGWMVRRIDGWEYEWIDGWMGLGYGESGVTLWSYFFLKIFSN